VAVGSGYNKRQMYCAFESGRDRKKERKKETKEGRKEGRKKEMKEKE